MLINTRTAFLLFNNPQIPIQKSSEDTIKKACSGIDSRFVIENLVLFY